MKKNQIPESDLLPTIRKWQQNIAPGTDKCLDEVESGYGRADLVFFNLNQENANSRSLHPISRMKSFQFLETLSLINMSTDEKVSVTSLIKKLPYSESFIRTKILGQIIKSKIATINNDYLSFNFNYKIAIENTVAIEAKVSNWKRGLYQAYRYKQYAKSSYLAICKDYSAAPLKNIDDFIKLNVGLLIVDTNSDTVEIAHRPIDSFSPSNFFRIYTNESVLSKMGYIPS